MVLAFFTKQVIMHLQMFAGLSRSREDLQANVLLCTHAVVHIQGTHICIRSSLQHLKS
jgi:hypothetical protein